MEDIQAVNQLAENITLIGFILSFMTVSLRYVDALRREEKSKKDSRTDDIIRDWKNLREID